MDSIVLTDVVKEYPGERAKDRSIFHPFKKERIRALDGLDLRLGKSEITSILGPNGAGKTTLIKILSSLLIPSSGEAWVEGHSVIEEADVIRRMVSYIPADERSFQWRLTSEENLRFFGRIYGLRGDGLEERIDRVMHVVDLPDYKEERVMRFSSGMKQRLSIARGLLKDPKVLLMDEPTKGLDPKVSIGIRKFVKKELVDKRSITVVWATHDMHEVERVSDRVIILNKGRVIKTGSVSEIKASLPQRKILFVVRPKDKAANAKLRDTYQKLRSAKGIFYSEMTKKDDSYILLFGASSKAELMDRVVHTIGRIPGLEIRDVRSMESSIEDAFVKVIDGDKGL